MRILSQTTNLLVGVALLATFTGPALAQDIGVASCDKFLATYKSCIVDKATGDQQSKVVADFEKTKANWKAVSATDAGKTELDSTCKKTAETLKAQVAALNCAW